MPAAKNRFALWRRDPVAFITEVLIDPETGKPFSLYPAQQRFLREALTLTTEGKLPFADMVFSCPKKSGKTATGAMAAIYVALVIGGKFAEVYCIANDFEQAQGRVFQAIARIIEASPLLRDSAKITANKIEFSSTGANITAIASDYAGAAGAAQALTIFDELWGVTREAGQRLWDEMVAIPTRRVSGRLVTTYAGFEGESDLLESLYKRGLQGEQIAPALYRTPGLLMFWSHDRVAPWQTPEWIEQMRSQLRPNAFLRLIENRWVSSESTFIDMDRWDACVDPSLAPAALGDVRIPIWVGIDASVKRDSTAIAAATFDNKAAKVRLVWHRIFQPSPSAPLNFEATIEATIRDLARRFYVREVRYDPFQMVSTAQRLAGQDLEAGESATAWGGIPMREFPQTISNLTEASNNLYDLIRGRDIVVYPDAEIRLAISRCVAVESARGWKISKEKQSHKIDVVIALAQAALGALQGRTDGGHYEFRPCNAPRYAGSRFDPRRAENPDAKRARERWADDADKPRSAGDRKWKGWC